ncbi:MAG: hypothetical protein JKY80_02000 [Mariprofundaceae bacterium]|nr:hypothetical protein [Methylophaga sp.]MBL4759613.1 hypothetical protein [Mariprofundaceae bacterium]
MPHDEAHKAMTGDIAKLEGVTRSLSHDINASATLMLARLGTLDTAIALARKENEYLRAEIAEYATALAKHAADEKEEWQRVSNLELLVAGLKGARWGVVGLVSVIWAAGIVAVRYFKG